jgi:hypothetical protein
MSLLLQMFDDLLSEKESCALLSVFHLQSFVVGIQTSLLSTGFRDPNDEKVGTAFRRQVMEKYGSAENEYQSISRKSPSFPGAVNLFIEEWRLCVESFRPTNASTPTEKLSVKIINLSDMMSAIERRPVMYLSTPDITHLSAFCDGVEYVAKHIGNLTAKPNLRSFEGWLRIRLAPMSMCSWDILLTSICGGNTVDAFSRFFEELRDFEATQKDEQLS